jgi:transcriptional regulator with PAS, ATPase and Fis domain
MDILNHSLRGNDFCSVFFSELDDLSPLLRVWKFVKLNRPAISFKRVNLHLHFSRQMILNDIARAPRPNSKDEFVPMMKQLESFDFETIKQKTIEHFESLLNVPVKIYGPKSLEINELENEILYRASSGENGQEKVYNFLINMNSKHFGDFRISFLGGDRKVRGFRHHKVNWNRIFLIHEIDNRGIISLNVPPDRNDLYRSGIDFKKADYHQYQLSIIPIREPKRAVIPEEFADIITVDQVMIDLINLAKFYSRASEHMLILGDTGTGKELFAKAIHNVRHSSKEESKFVALNCAAISQHLAESQLFGYLPGAFTDASKTGFIGLIGLANNGTLFLDEFGELSPELQAKLLRTIDTGKYRKLGAENEDESKFKLICATNKNLTDKSIFRQDLFFRVSKLPIRIPSLSERGKDDIAKLSKFFLESTVNSYRKDFEENSMNPDLKNPSFYFTTAALVEFSKYEWPGNVRQLSAFVLKLVYQTLFKIQEGKKQLENDGRIKLDFDDIIYLLREERRLYMDESLNIDRNNPIPVDSAIQDKPNAKLFTVDLHRVNDLKSFLNEIEKEYLEAAIGKWGSQIEIGKNLCLSQPTVHLKLKKYGLLVHE